MMARRQVGLGALDRTKTTSEQYTSLSTSLSTQSISDLQSQLRAFQSLLSQFSQLHASEIRQNPSFRSEFAKMCNSIGVDPLVASTRKTGTRAKVKDGLSGWGMLGVGEFWIGVATRVVGVCRRTRGENGGFISVDEVRRILVAEDKKARRKDVVEISESAPHNPLFHVFPPPAFLLPIFPALLLPYFPAFRNRDLSLVLR
jgi:ESCRT-II complex subunit VPS22